MQSELKERKKKQLMILTAVVIVVVTRAFVFFPSQIKMWPHFTRLNALSSLSSAVKNRTDLRTFASSAIDSLIERDQNDDARYYCSSQTQRCYVKDERET